MSKFALTDNTSILVTAGIGVLGLGVAVYGFTQRKSAVAEAVSETENNPDSIENNEVIDDTRAGDNVIDEDKLKEEVRNSEAFKKSDKEITSSSWNLFWNTESEKLTKEE